MQSRLGSLCLSTCWIHLFIYLMGDDVELQSLQSLFLFCFYFC